MATDTALFGACLVAAATLPVDNTEPEIEPHGRILQKAWSLYLNALSSVSQYDFYMGKDRPLPENHPAVATLGTNERRGF